MSQSVPPVPMASGNLARRANSAPPNIRKAPANMITTGKNSLDNVYLQSEGCGSGCNHGRVGFLFTSKCHFQIA